MALGKLTLAVINQLYINFMHKVMQPMVVNISLSVCACWELS